MPQIARMHPITMTARRIAEIMSIIITAVWIVLRQAIIIVVRVLPVERDNTTRNNATGVAIIKN